MSHSQSVFNKYISPQMITSSFTGMIMALPLVFALNSSASRVNTYQAQPAVQNQSTAQVTQADFAKYMYAYDQGYQAHTASTPTGTTVTPNTCTDPSSGSGSTDMPSAPMAMTTASKMPMKSHAPLASVVNSYNSFVSTVNNSSSVTNTNSNNTVGSNNVTKTTIDAKELKGVTIDNSQTTTQVAAVDSFNKDSYNTKTDTTIVNDSFNKQVAINSGNTSTETTDITNNVTKTIDSNNTTNVTKDSNNTLDMTNTMTDTTNVTKTENTTIGSYNTSVDVDLGNGNHGGPQHPAV